MFGFVDYIFSSVNCVHEDEKSGAKEYTKYTIERGSDIWWICFLPRRTSLEVVQAYGLLPQKGNLLIYEVPLNLIADDPHLTRESFFELIADFDEQYEDKLKGKKIAFWGISVGSMPVFYLANKYSCEKMRVICSTARLGHGIFSAFAARQIKQSLMNKGIDAKKYDQVLGEINPIYNVDNLPRDTKMVMSRFDRYIPFSGMQELAGSITKKKKSASIYRYRYFGHVMTIFVAGLRNKWTGYLD